MNYELGSEIEIPGLEAVMEYGYATDVRSDRIPGAYQINDQSALEHVRLSAISGIHDDPDGRDAREPKSDLHGENPGRMFYDGRTIGLTGVVQAGSITRMRDEWRRFKRQFGTGNKDLLLHSPYEVPIVVNSMPAGFGANVGLSAVPVNTITLDDISPWRVNWATAGAGTIALAGGVVVGQLLVGELTITSATAAGDADAWAGGLPWQGEDAFLHVMVRANSGAISSFSLYAVLDSPGATSDLLVATQASPTVGTWYVLSGRLAASAIAALPRTTTISLKVRAHVAGAGTYVARYARPMLTLLDATDPTPQFLDGSMDGFAWDGASYGSASRGPIYASNMVSDPRFEDVKTVSATNMLNKWAPANSASVTVNELSAVRQVGGTSLFYDATKDATATSRDMGVVDVNPLETFLGSHLVAAGRSYRFSATVNITQLPATGLPRLAIEWYGINNATALSTSFGATLTAGVTAATLTAVAPAGAVSALVKVVLTGCTTSSGRIKFFVSDPCFVETTAWDPGFFDGTDLDGNEIAIPGTLVTSEGARRLIPRPWLISKVRKAAEGSKAPEQQSRNRAWRDFTMSLRAADPRIYPIDERRRSLKLVGASQLVLLQGSVGFTLGTYGPLGVISGGGLPIRTGFTYEGHYITYPGTGVNYFWGRDAYNYTVLSDPPVLHPNDGVGFQDFIPYPGGSGANRPANDIRARMYRSAEGFTYQNPKIILGGAPSGGGRASVSGGFGTDRDFNVVIGTSSVLTTYITSLLKRVASGTWLEVRWGGVSKVFVDRIGLTAPSQAFEIWCSHTTAGAAGVTKLAGWDYASYDSSVTGGYPFSPTLDAMYLVTWMLNNTIFVELWRGYPSPTDFFGNPIDTTNRLESFSFALPAGLVSVVGSGVAGHAGYDLMVPKGVDQASFDGLSAHPPFTHYFEASKADVPPVTVSIPVIGEVDTPPKIVLTDMVDPVVSITTPAFEGLPSATTVARFSGTLTTTNPITIDLAADPGNAMIVDAQGNNAYNLLVTGSRFQMLRPGINYVTVTAKTWGTSQEHVQVVWRDART